MADAPFSEIDPGDLSAQAELVQLRVRSFDIRLGIAEGGGAGGNDPTVTVDVPEGELEADAILTAQVLDDGPLRAVLLMAKFPSLGVWEVIYDGNHFGPLYTAAPNERRSISGGLEFRLRRRGGWPADQRFTLRAVAIDTGGGEAG